MLWVMVLLLEIEKYDVGNTYALWSNVVSVLYFFLENTGLLDGS